MTGFCQARQGPVGGDVPALALSHGMRERSVDPDALRSFVAARSRSRVEWQNDDQPQTDSKEDAR
jgi:hypothetical protein